ncbi:MAG: hypothetical protein ILO42_06540 [Clostridia bacterium]|nr:hypothetical protein [Clostridia bacterium]
MSTVLYIIAAFSFLISLAWAFGRGPIKARYRFLTVLLSAVGAFLIVFFNKPKLGNVGPLIVSILQRVFPGQDMTEVSAVLSDFPGAGQAVAGVVYAIVAPLAFFILFNLIRFVTWIIYLIATIAARDTIKSHEENMKLRPLRTLIYGILQFAVVFFILLTPVYSLSSAATPILNSLGRAGIIPAASTVSDVSDVVAQTSGTPVMKLYARAGGDLMNTALTSFTVREEKTTLEAETDSIGLLAGDVSSIMHAGDPEKWSNEQAEAIKSISSSLTESKIINAVVCDGVGAVSSKWMNGEDFLGLKKPDIGETMQPAFDKLVVNLNMDSKDSAAMSADLKSFGDIISVLIRDGVMAKIKDGEGITDIITKGQTIKDIIDILRENPSLAELSDFFTDLGMKAIGDVIKLPEIDPGVSENFFSEVTDTINDILAGLDFNDKESVRAAVRLLAEKFKAEIEAAGFDVDLSDDMIDYYADVILSQFRDADGNIKVDDLKALFGIS